MNTGNIQDCLEHWTRSKRFCTTAHLGECFTKITIIPLEQIFEQLLLHLIADCQRFNCARWLCTDKVKHFPRICLIQVASLPFAIIKNYFCEEHFSWERSEGEAAPIPTYKSSSTLRFKVQFKKIFPGQRARVKKTKFKNKEGNHPASKFIFIIRRKQNVRGSWEEKGGIGELQLIMFMRRKKHLVAGDFRWFDSAGNGMESDGKDEILKRKKINF